MFNRKNNQENIERMYHLMEKIASCVPEKSNPDASLEAYKVEMKERCQRLSEQINHNKEMNANIKRELENKIKEHSNDSNITFSKISGTINKVISIAITLLLCVAGALATLQINKLSLTEHYEHVKTYQTDKVEIENKLSKFLINIDQEREKRDKKLDEIFERQMKFNEEIMKSNSLLQTQMEVLKSKVDRISNK